MTRHNIFDTAIWDGDRYQAQTQRFAKSNMKLSRLKSVRERHLRLTVLVLCVLSGLCAVWLFPNLTERGIQYMLNALGRVRNQILGFSLIQIGLGILVILTELLVVGWKRSSFRQFLHPDKSSITDILIFFVNALQIDYILMFILTAEITGYPSQSTHQIKMMDR
jgi:hypothetical protein